MDAKIRKKIKQYAKSLKWTPKDFYWRHTLQVRKFALIIQKRAKGDEDVIEAAALLHDIGKARLLKPGHEEISAKLAEEFLDKIVFSKNKIKKVTQCIKYENFRTVETRILRSADSMSLIMDNSGGREWFFENVLKNNRERILKELEKSYFDICFDFARELVEEDYRNLLLQYT
jgi:putative nucleotidyltransferase with HDIG domain